MPIKNLLTFLAPNTLARYQRLVEEINHREGVIQGLDSQALQDRVHAIRASLGNGEDAARHLADVFALVREAARRTLGQRHFDVQLVGGLALWEGKIAQMLTGEGKTLAATLPAFLEGLSGKGVHIVTVNDYLARRDTVWMGQIYHFLGLKVGCLVHEGSYVYDPSFAKATEGEAVEELEREQDTLGAFRVVHEFLRPVTRQEAYQCDILYGTNHEFGFDYLRDHLAEDPSQVVQRGHHYAIIDEVDSILIDEARTPLIISVPDHDAPKLWGLFTKIMRDFREDHEYTVDRKRRTVSLNPEGIERAEKALGISHLYTPEGSRYVHFLEQSVRAVSLFERDRDYVVKNGEVIIVDEFTGRLMPGRRWSDGLHQAVEAKEGVAVQAESRTVATITLQNYFRMYSKLAGMTGTAITSAEEFEKVYGLDVVEVPTNRPMVRRELPDRIYQTERAKWQAVVQEVKERHERGQPLLIGTVSIEKNEHLDQLLRAAGIPHAVLNAKNHEQEAQVISQTGRSVAVTVATNMAGRGVDIILGGNPPGEADRAKVIEAGGLHVIGTERHEARRIDNQLRGRSGRQGDPGSSQFFVSLEDELLKIFGGERIKGLMQRLNVPEDQPIEHPIISRSIAAAQAKVEGLNFDLRKHLLEYDDVLNAQRKAVYRERERILAMNEMGSEVLDIFEKTFGALTLPTEEGLTPEERKERMRQFISFLFPGLGEGQVNSLVEASNDAEEFRRRISHQAQEIWEATSQALASEDRLLLARRTILRTIDMLWIGHLEAMEHLREAVRLRAYGQRDPLVEYKTEGRKLWQDFWDRFRENVTLTLLRMEVRPGMQMATPAPVVVSSPSNPAKVGRNDPCPCGATHPDGRPKKWKHCHGRNA